MPYEQVYADFLQHCQPGRYGRFSKAADVWNPPLDWAQMLAALQAKHGDRDLCRSGIAVRDENNKTLDLRLMYRQLHGFVLPLRKSPGGNPFDLLTDGGTASGRLPMFAAAKDHLVAEGIAKTGLLFMTFSLDEMLLLRTVGLPAALALGLGGVTERSLKEFKLAMGLAGPMHAPQASHWPGPGGGNTAPSQLVFVGWSPSEHSPRRPEKFDHVLRNVQLVGNSVGLNMEDVLQWHPTTAEIRQVHFCLQKGSRKDVRRSIQESLDRSATALTPTRSNEKPSGDLLEARTRFRNSLLQPGGSADCRRKRLREYQELVESVFARPLLERAAGESDPDERSRLAGLAAANGILHPMAEVYLARLEKEISRTGLRGDGEVLGLKELTKLLDVVYRFTKDRK